MRPEFPPALPPAGRPPSAQPSTSAAGHKRSATAAGLPQDSLRSPLRSSSLELDTLPAGLPEFPGLTEVNRDFMPHADDDKRRARQLFLHEKASPATVRGIVSLYVRDKTKQTKGRETGEIGKLIAAISRDPLLSNRAIKVQATTLLKTMCLLEQSPVAGDAAGSLSPDQQATLVEHTVCSLRARDTCEPRKWELFNALLRCNHVVVAPELLDWSVAYLLRPDREINSKLDNRLVVERTIAAAAQQGVRFTAQTARLCANVFLKNLRLVPMPAEKTFDQLSGAAKFAFVAACSKMFAADGEGRAAVINRASELTIALHRSPMFHLKNHSLLYEACVAALNSEERLISGPNRATLLAGVVQFAFRATNAHYGGASVTKALRDSVVRLARNGVRTAPSRHDLNELVVSTLAEVERCSADHEAVTTLRARMLAALGTVGLTRSDWPAEQDDLYLRQTVRVLREGIAGTEDIAIILAHIHKILTERPGFKEACNDLHIIVSAAAAAVPQCRNVFVASRIHALLGVLTPVPTPPHGETQAAGRAHTAGAPSLPRPHAERAGGSSVELVTRLQRRFAERSWDPTFGEELHRSIDLLIAGKAESLMEESLLGALADYALIASGPERPDAARAAQQVMSFLEMGARRPQPIGRPVLVARLLRLHAQAPALQGAPAVNAIVRFGLNAVRLTQRAGSNALTNELLCGLVDMQRRNSLLINPELDAAVTALIQAALADARMTQLGARSLFRALDETVPRREQTVASVLTAEQRAMLATLTNITHASTDREQVFTQLSNVIRAAKTPLRYEESAVLAESIFLLVRSASPQAERTSRVVLSRLAVTDSLLRPALSNRVAALLFTHACTVLASIERRSQVDARLCASYCESMLQRNCRVSPSCSAAVLRIVGELRELSLRDRCQLNTRLLAAVSARLLPITAELRPVLLRHVVEPSFALAGNAAIPADERERHKGAYEKARRYLLDTAAEDDRLVLSEAFTSLADKIDFGQSERLLE